MRKVVHQPTQEVFTMKVHVFVTKSQAGNIFTWICEEVGKDTFEVTTYNKEGCHLEWRNRMSGSVLAYKLNREPECLSHCIHEVR
jgi:hypothetical protein